MNIILNFQLTILSGGVLNSVLSQVLDYMHYFQAVLTGIPDMYWYGSSLYKKYTDNADYIATVLNRNLRKKRRTQKYNFSTY